MTLLNNTLIMNDKIIEEKQEYKLDPDTKKDIDDIKRIIDDTTMEFHNYEFPKYIANYKKYLWFVADRLSSIDEWQSNVDYPLVASVVDTMFWNLFDFWYEVWINESKLKRICTEAFDFRWIGKATFKEATKEILICGKAYVKDIFLKEEIKNKFFGKDINQIVKTPSMQYISIFDVMYDRTKWLTKSSYKIVRTFQTWDAIKAKLIPTLQEAYPEETKKSVPDKLDKLLKAYKEDYGSRFSIYDYNPVKSLTSTTQFINADSSFNFDLPVCIKKSDLVWWISWDQIWWWVHDEFKNNYFLNVDKSTYELVEYTTVNDQKVIFINGNLIYTGKKQYNLGEIREANFSLVPWTGNANGVADNLWWLQDINNMLWNAFLDNIKLVMGPMFRVSGNIPIGKNWTLDFKKFKAFRTNGNNNIEKIQLGATDFAPVNFMQIVQSFAEQRSWVSNYIMWWQGSIERVSWGIDMKFNQYKSKLTPITDSIDQMMWNIMRSWILMYFKFYTKDELLKMWIKVEEVFVTDKDWKQKFDTFNVNGIDIRSIIDERNITFTYNSLNKLTKENSRAAVKEALPAMLQYAGESVNMQEIIKLLVWQDFDPEKIIYSDKEQTQRKQFAGQWQWQWWPWAWYTWWWWNYPSNESWPTSWWYESSYDMKSGQQQYSSPIPTYQDYTDEQLLSTAGNIS